MLKPILLCIVSLFAALGWGATLTETQLRAEAQELTASETIRGICGGERTLLKLEKISFPKGDLWVAHLSPSGHAILTNSTNLGVLFTVSERAFVYPPEDSPFYRMLDSVAAAAIEAEASGVEKEEPAQASLLALPTYSYIPPITKTSWNQNGTLSWLAPRSALGGCTAAAYGQLMCALEWPVWLGETRSKRLQIGASYYETFYVYPHTKIDYSKMTEKAFWTMDRGDQTLEMAKLAMVVGIEANMWYNMEGEASGAYVANAATNPWYEPYESLMKGDVISGDFYDNYLLAFRKAAEDGIPVCAEIESSAGYHSVMLSGWSGESGSEMVYCNLGWGANNQWVTNNTWIRLNIVWPVVDGIRVAYVSRPKKTVQVAPLRKVSTAQPMLEWALPKCYDDDVSGFTVKVTGNGTTQTHQLDKSARTWTPGTALTEGVTYTFSVTPVFTSSTMVAVESNKVSTTIRADADMETRTITFASGSNLPHPDMNFKDGAYRSVSFNGSSVIHVTAPPSTVNLTIHSMRPETYPASTITIHDKGSGRYDLVVDGTKPTDRYENTRVLYTVCATDAHGTITAKEMILHYNFSIPSESYADEPEPEPVEYTVQVTKIGNGTVTGAGTYEEGTTVTLRAIPDSGYTFSGWSGDKTSSNASLTFEVTENVSITATFTKEETPDPEPEPEPDPEPDPEDPVNPDSGYTGTFYVTGADAARYDANKVGGDSNLCWAYSFANMIAWYQDMYETVDGNQIDNKKEIREASAIAAKLKMLSGNVSGDFSKGVTNYTNEGYMLSYINGLAWNPISPAAYTSYYPENNGEVFTTLAGFSKLLLDNLYKGPAFIALLNDGSSGGHAVVIWGAEFEDGIVKSVYISDSDDNASQYAKYPVTLSGGRINFYESWASRVNAVTFLYAPSGVEVTPPQNETDPDDTIEMPAGTSPAERTAAIAAVREKLPGKTFTKIKNPGVLTIIPGAGVKLEEGVATFTYDFGVSSLEVTADGRVKATATLGGEVTFAEGVTVSLVDMDGNPITADHSANGNVHTFTFDLPDAPTFIFKVRATK